MDALRTQFVQIGFLFVFRSRSLEMKKKRSKIKFSSDAAWEKRLNINMNLLNPFIIGWERKYTFLEYGSLEKRV